MDWRIVRALLLSGSVLCGTAQHLAYAGPAVATKWRTNGEAQNICLGHAQEALRRNGFELLDPGSQSMMGNAASTPPRSVACRRSCSL
jgi:hypothetical protein